MTQKFRPIDQTGKTQFIKILPDSSNYDDTVLTKRLTHFAQHYGLQSKDDKNFFSFIKTPYFAGKGSRFFYMFETIDWILVLYKASYTTQTEPFLNSTSNGDLLRSSTDIDRFVSFYNDLIHLTNQNSASFGYNRIFFSESFYDTKSFSATYFYFVNTLMPLVFSTLGINKDEDYLISHQSKTLFLLNHVLTNFILDPYMIDPSEMTTYLEEIRQLITISNIDRLDKNKELTFDVSLYSGSHIPLDELITNHIFMEHSLTETPKTPLKGSGLPARLGLKYKEKVKDYARLKISPKQYIHDFSMKLKRLILKTVHYDALQLNSNFDEAKFIESNQELINRLESYHSDEDAKELLIRLDQAAYPLFETIPTEKFITLLGSIDDTASSLELTKRILENYEGSNSPVEIADAFKEYELQKVNSRIAVLTEKREAIQEQSPEDIMADLKKRYNTTQQQDISDDEKDVAKDFVRILINNFIKKNSDA